MLCHRAQPTHSVQEGRGLDGPLVLPPPAPFALTDASSLLWRMDLLAVETGAMRWRGVAEVRDGSF